jgi:hypothetical protein
VFICGYGILAGNVNFQGGVIMQMKSGYVWILLLLATTACTPSQEQQVKSENPLFIVQEIEKEYKLEQQEGKPESTLLLAQSQEEEDRQALMLPVDLTPKEKLFWSKSKTGSPTPLEGKIRLTIMMKLEIEKIRQNYERAVAEQEKQHLAQSNEQFHFMNQEGCKSLTPARQASCREYIFKQEQANLKRENKILKTWGEGIVEMSKLMKFEDYDTIP